MACPQVRLPAEQGMCRGGELFRAGADDRAAAQVMSKLVLDRVGV
jgi:hypothetical protein